MDMISWIIEFNFIQYLLYSDPSSHPILLLRGPDLNMGPPPVVTLHVQNSTSCIHIASILISCHL